MVMVALTRIVSASVAAANRTRSAWLVTVTVAPPAPPVVPVANPSGTLDQGLALPAGLKAHCMRAMSEHGSWMMGLPPAVEPSLSLMHRLVATLRMRYLPEAAEDAVKVQDWLA